MTAAENEHLSALYRDLRPVRGACLPLGERAAEIAASKGLSTTVAAEAAVLWGRVPFPSIDGNPPVDRDRPFFNVRYWESLRGPD